MQQSDIYLAAGSSVREVSNLACRLCEKIFSAGQTALVVCSNARQAKEFDELLWSFKDGAFVPHQLAVEPSDAYPLAISDEEELADHEFEQRNTLDTIIYLNPKLLTKEPKHSRRLVIVANQEETLDKARKLFKSLKQNNQTVNTHDLRTR